MKIILNRYDTIEKNPYDFVNIFFETTKKQPFLQNKTLYYYTIKPLSPKSVITQGFNKGTNEAQHLQCYAKKG